MSTTAFEILLNRREDETGIPDGDFRSSLVDLVKYIKQSRGSEMPLEDGIVFEFDPLVPTVEEFFVAMTKVVSHWFSSFNGYQIFSIEKDLFTIDDGIYGIYPYLSINDGEVDPIGAADEEFEDSEQSYAPYFHQLNRAILPVDAEFAGILETLAKGDYPRYQKYGVTLFLLDLVWWGWQTFRGEGDGRGEGDISFVVTQNLGTDNLTFKCFIQLGQQVISLAQSESVNTFSDIITNFGILDASKIDFSKFSGIDDYGELPDTAIALTLGKIVGSVEITDIILRLQPPTASGASIVYSCNPSPQEFSLFAVKASYSRNNFVLKKQIINLNSPTGIELTANSKTSLGFFFTKQDPASYESDSLNYILQLFSGSKLIASQYFTLGESSDLVSFLIDDLDS